MWASANGYDEIVTLHLQKEETDTELKDRNGKTASDLAKMNGHQKIVTMLEKHAEKKRIGDAKVLARGTKNPQRLRSN